MSAQKSQAAAAARRTALRRAATISLSLGVAALPVLQSTGASLLSDLESADAELLDLDDEEFIEEDDEFVDAALIEESEEIDGPGKYELQAQDDDQEGTLWDARGRHFVRDDGPGNSADAPRGAPDDEIVDEQGEDTTE